MLNKLGIERTLFGTTEQYCENDQATHVALGHRPLGEKCWAETTQSALTVILIINVAV